MAEDRFQHEPSVGLIATKGSLAARVRKVMRGAGLSIDFEASPEEIAKDHPIGKSEIMLVIAILEPRDGSLLRLLRAVFPDTRIVVCAERVKAPTIRWALDMGVDGLLWSTRLDQALELTIRAVHSGQVVLPGDVLRGTMIADLTNREKQALSMVIMGLTNLEIAQKLFISESTVKSHLNTAYRKLGVHSRAEAQRLITDPDQGLGTGILAITAPGLSRGRPPRKEQVPN